MNDVLSNYPTVISLPVNWGDMDALRHVNNSVYFRYFESARLAFLESIECWPSLRAAGVGPVLASTSARYKLPLTYPDTIDVGARISTLGDDRFEMRYAVYSHQHRRIATEGKALVVTVNRADGRKTPLPAPFKAALQELITE